MEIEETKVKISEEWKKLLEAEFEKPYFKGLSEKVRKEYLQGTARPDTKNGLLTPSTRQNRDATQSNSKNGKQQTKSLSAKPFFGGGVFPHPSRVFRAFELVKPEEVRVVILGQDPYHTPGVADGLAFSTLPQNPIPPSLNNMFKEIESEFGISVNRNPDLSRWAKQGVLLLNASLSVRSGQANSHADYGWHTFTDAVISAISSTQEHVVFLLWGAFAGKKEELIDWEKHLVLKSAHPSPLSASRGFFGNNHFKFANEYIKEHGYKEIDWQ